MSILPGLSATCEHGFPITHPCQFCRADAGAGRDRANLHALMSGEPGRFLPTPPEGWAGFAGGTDPDGVPWCPADVPLGWECPRCHRVWNPSVLACHNCPQPPAFIAKGADPGPIETG